MSAITSRTRCTTCMITGHDMAEDIYLRVNGTNEVACLGHAREMETRHPDYTFQGVTPDVAAWLTAH